jgi:hypothetical protein
MKPSSLASMEHSDDELSLDDVPAEVKKAASQSAPGSKWSSASSQTIYELEGTNAKGRSVFVEVTDEGEVTDVSTEIPLKEVPDVIVTAFKAKHPRFQVSTIFESRLKGKVVGYSVEGRRPNDKEDIGLFVSADGKSIEIDEGD